MTIIQFVVFVGGGSAIVYAIASLALVVRATLNQQETP